MAASVGALRNAILGNLIRSTTGKGIQLVSGGNGGLDAPLITAAR